MSRAELLQRYFDDELAPDARRHVDRTMSRSERDELADLTMLRVLLRECFAGSKSSAVHRADRLACGAPDCAPAIAVDAAGRCPKNRT